jgi:hypothetical protein
MQWEDFRVAGSIVLFLIVVGAGIFLILTRGGKALVLINAAFSLVLAAAAAALLYYRVDWSNSLDPGATPSENAAARIKAARDYLAQGKEPAGELVRREVRLDDFRNAVRPAESAWYTARTGLVDREARLTSDRNWYAQQLAFLRTGVFWNQQTNQFQANPDAAVGTVVLDDKGYTTPDPNNNGLPALAPAKDRFGADLHPLPYYRREQPKVLQNLAAELAALDAAKKEDTALTLLLIGDPDKQLKGLTERIEAEKAKRDAVVEEQKLIEPKLVNTYVDNELLLSRQKQLESRKKELEAGVTRKPQ